MRKSLVLHVVGARPNYMKVAPVYAALESRGAVEQQLVHTGQHYDPEVNDVFFAELPLPAPHIQLGIGSGSHGVQTGRALMELERVFLELDPDLVLVPGDVNSTLAGALAAVKLEIPVCHLEAGLRSFDPTMPEEHNRKVTDHLSSLLLTPSIDGNENLAREGITEGVELIGNTMIDTLMANVSQARARATWRDFGVAPHEYILVTLHRPRLVDDDALLAATVAILDELGATIPVVFPIHPRTRKRLEAGKMQPKHVKLAAPLSYGEFLSLQIGARAVVTDSGGIQEETTALGVRCFTLRENTERPVTVSQGTNTLLGIDPRRLRDIPRLLDEHKNSVVPALWDGEAGSRAAGAIERFLDEFAMRRPAAAVG
jgi:UDP-N-acetylglucosamine 2-epimerase (non-hydrolysing)